MRWTAFCTSAQLRKSVNVDSKSILIIFLMLSYNIYQSKEILSVFLLAVNRLSLCKVSIYGLLCHKRGWQIHFFSILH